MQEDSNKNIFNRREIERKIIACLVKEPMPSDASRDVLASLSGLDFSERSLGLAFDAIKRLSSEGLRIGVEVVVAATQNKITPEELTGAASGLDGEAVSSYLPSLARALKEYSMKDALRQLLDYANNALTCGMAIETILPAVQDRLTSISSETKTRVRGAMEARKKQVEKFRSMANGTFKEEERIPLGIPEVDELLRGGISKGSLAILAARPSCGKTALAVSVATRTLQDGKKVFFASLEMGDSEIVDRLSACFSGVPIPYSMKFWNELERDARHDKGLRNGLEELQDIEGFENYASRLRFLDNAPYDEFFNEIKLSFSRENFDVLILDYLQLLQGRPGEGLRETVVKISGGLKSLARELNIPILALAQLNRDSSKEGRPPRMTDLKESGSIEQDADIVILLSEGSDESERLSLKQYERPRLLDVVKHRQGRTGSFKLVFEPTCFRFRAREAGSPNDSTKEAPVPVQTPPLAAFPPMAQAPVLAAPLPEQDAFDDELLDSLTNCEEADLSRFFSDKTDSNAPPIGEALEEVFEDKQT